MNTRNCLYPHLIQRDEAYKLFHPTLNGIAAIVLLAIIIISALQVFCFSSIA